MIERNTIKGYQTIVGQAALSLSLRTTATPDMVRYYEGQYGAYLHAARLLLDVNEQDSGHAYQDIQIHYQRLWAASDTRWHAVVRHGHSNPRVVA